MTQGPTAAVFELAVRLQKANALFRRLVGQHARRYEMQSGDIHVICSLGTSGPLRMCDLADAISVSPPSLTRMIGRLESHGSVRRRKSSQSDREVLVELTDRGAAIFNSCYPAACSSIKERIAQQLTPTELETLTELLSRLVDGARP